jgi:hypothetical protein
VKKWQPNDLEFTATNTPADTRITRLMRGTHRPRQRCHHRPGVLRHRQRLDRSFDGIAVDPATVTLVAGQRNAITLAVYEGVKTALARLSWASPGQADQEQVIPGASLSSL